MVQKGLKTLLSHFPPVLRKILFFKYLFIYAFVYFCLCWIFVDEQVFLRLQQAGGCSLVVVCGLLIAGPYLLAELWLQGEQAQ